MSYHLHTGDSEAFQIFRSLKGTSGHIKEGLFIAESPKIVTRVLRSGLTIRSAILTQQFFARYEQHFASRAETIDIRILPKPALESIVGYPLHQGVMLAVEIPKSLQLDQFLSRSSGGTIVMLDSIADAENMGTILRTCAAFNVDAVAIDSQSCDPYLRRAVRVSMGAIIELEIIRVASLVKAIATLREKHWQVIGASLSSESIPIGECSFGEKLVFVFGSEGHGMRLDIARSCDRLINIPIGSAVDSLNVGVASGIVLHERARRNGVMQ